MTTVALNMVTSTMHDSLDSEKSQNFIKTICETDYSTLDPKISIDKAECAFSCDSVESPYGLYINLKNFFTVGHDFLPLDSERYNGSLYLNIVQRYTLAEKPERDNLLYHLQNDFYINIPSNSNIQSLEANNIPPKLANLLVTLISKPLSNPDLYQGEDHLPQIENPPMINLDQRKCADCGKTENLWLHLYDGFIGCGRKFFKIENTGCADGREGAAVRHYIENASSCILAVKLGTLSTETSEIYSYVEDDMVYDPLLREHLAHFGITLDDLKKTEKSLFELEYEYNQTYEWKQTRSDFTPTNHAGAIGLNNISNTCYFNCIIQMLAHIPDIQLVFNESAYATLLGVIDKTRDPRDIFLLQFCKTICGLTSDRYNLQKKEVIKSLTEPVKQIYNQGNFCSKFANLFARHILNLLHLGKLNFLSDQFYRQQDVEEFFRYFVDYFDTYMKSEGCFIFQTDLLMNKLFGFQIDEIFRYNVNSRMKFSTSSEIILTLPIPSHDSLASNDNTIDQSKRLKVDDMCLEDWLIDDNFELEHPSKGSITGTVSRHFLSHPPYLCVQLARFYLGDDKTAKKNSIPIAMPEIITLPPCETIEVEEDVLDNPIDQEIIQQLISINFSEPAARKAVSETKAKFKHSTFESSLDWLIENQSEIVKLQESVPNNPKNIKKTTKLLTEMGFTPTQIAISLTKSQGDEMQALDWLTCNNVSHEDINGLVLDSMNKDQEPCTYSLIGFIIHMGKNANCGHCVAYIKLCCPETGVWNWYTFNDNQVGICKKPLLNSGYLYFYQKVRV